MELSSHATKKAGLGRHLLRPCVHSILVKPHSTHGISPQRATSSIHSITDAQFPRIGRTPCNANMRFCSSRLRAQQDQGSLGPDESQSVSNAELGDEELYRRAVEEFPTELADDIDPEEKELTLEDLMTAQGGIPASLRSELDSEDVWGPPVSPAPYPSAECCSRGDHVGNSCCQHSLCYTCKQLLHLVRGHLQQAVL